MAVFKYVTVAAQATRPSLKMPVKVHTRKNRTLFRLYLISPGVHCTDGQRFFFFFFFLMKAIDKIQNSAPSTKGARPASERMYSYVFFRFVALQQYSIHFQQFTGLSI